MPRVSNNIQYKKKKTIYLKIIINLIKKHRNKICLYKYKNIKEIKIYIIYTFK